MAAKNAAPAAPEVAPALPATITLAASYSGFRDDGSYYTYPADAVVYDPTDIAYFIARDVAVYPSVTV